MSEKGQKKPWTQLEDSDLVQYWHNGLTLSEIAAQFPRLSIFDDGGRNAVTGRINRLREAAQSNAEKLFWIRKDGSSSTKRSAETVANASYVARCTEPGIDGPCGATAVPGTARCATHGGWAIKRVKITGEATLHT